jgi:DNA invertase Pin-like site-specific DNA recombinase
MLTGELRQAIISQLVLASSSKGGGDVVLQKGIYAGLAKKFYVHRSTVLRIWKRAKNNCENGDGSFHASPQKKGRCGKK